MSDQTSQAPLLKEHEAAEYLSVGIATLRRWRWAGKGPPFLKIGGAVRYNLSDLVAFVEQSKRLITSDVPLTAEGAKALRRSRET